MIKIETTTKNKLKSAMFLFSAAILFMISITPASAAGLRADIVRYEPAPVEIGQYFTVWVKIENIGYERAEDLSVEVVSAYPFSVDPKESAIKNIGILPDEAALFEFHIYVDENAKPGTRELKVRYQDSKDNGWIEKSFDIQIGSDTLDSRGTLQLQSIKTQPEVLMPGDRGTVTLTLKNSGTSGSIRIDGQDYNTNARVQSAGLLGAGDVTVTSDTYLDMGILGPGDTMSLTYNIEVAQNAVEGTKHLELKVLSNSHSYSYKWDIPVEVGSESIKVIQSRPLIINSTGGTIEFDVANTHRNTLSSVSIKPVSEGIEFSPAEYFIGTMDPDELFTIEFEARAVAGNASAANNLTIITQYRNGNNLHTTEVKELHLTVAPVKSDSQNALAMFSAVFAVFAVSGVLVYRYKKHQK